MADRIHGLRPKKLLVSVTVPPAPVRVPSQRLLVLSVTSVTSVANDKDLLQIIILNKFFLRVTKSKTKINH